MCTFVASVILALTKPQLRWSVNLKLNLFMLLVLLSYYVMSSELYAYIWTLPQILISGGAYLIYITADLIHPNWGPQLYYVGKNLSSPQFLAPPR